MSGQFQKIEYFVKKPEKGIHTEMHALAKEISEFCGEPEKFATGRKTILYAVLGYAIIWIGRGIAIIIENLLKS